MIKKPKALAVYQAVLEQLDEGMDINRLTVAEIADRAGIGKGTVYEYFSSKEELVVSAILYEMEQITEEIHRLLEPVKGFQQKIYRLFEAMEQGQKEKKLARFIRMMNSTKEIGTSLCQELERHEGEIQSPHMLLLELYEEGIQEGILKKELPKSLGCITLVSKFVMFLSFLEKRSQMPDLEEGSMKDYLYQGLVADLNVEIL